MKALPECGPCLEGLVRRVAEAAAGADAELQREAFAAGLRILDRAFRPGACVPPRLATVFQRAVRRLSGNDDPFRPVKDAEYSAGCAAARRLAPPAGSPLEALLLHSVLGNQLDFFRPLEEVESAWGATPSPLAADEAREFRARVVRSRAVLVLADNAGEVPFDLPLLEGLRGLGPAIHYAVKGGPSQNDATREDLRRFGLDAPGLVDTGTDAVGCELRETGAEFRAVWDRVDLVLAKGMANYETLTEYPEALTEKPVFFLLCAKCGPVASSVGLAVGASALLRARLS